MLFKNIAHDRDPKFIIYLVLVLFIFRSSSMNVCIRSLEFLTELIVWGVTKLLHVCSTSIPLKHHPLHQVPVLRKVSPLLRIYTKLKFKKVCHSYFCSFLWLLRPIPRSKWLFFCPISSPSLVASDLTLTNTKYGEGMVTLANAVSVLLKLCHYWRRCFLIPDKTYLQITAK